MIPSAQAAAAAAITLVPLPVMLPAPAAAAPAVARQQAARSSSSTITTSATAATTGSLSSRQQRQSGRGLCRPTSACLWSSTGEGGGVAVFASGTVVQFVQQCVVVILTRPPPRTHQLTSSCIAFSRFMS